MKDKFKLFDLIMLDDSKNMRMVENKSWTCVGSICLNCNLKTLCDKFYTGQNGYGSSAYLTESEMKEFKELHPEHFI